MKVEKQNNNIVEPMLVVCADTPTNHNLRESLAKLGFRNVRGVYSHRAGLKAATSEKFTRVLFDTPNSDMPSADFLAAMLEHNLNYELIALADELRLDDVFALLRAGAKSFLIVPFTVHTLEQSIRYADRELEIAEELLDEANRDNVLAEIVLNNLNAICHLLSLRHSIKASAELRAVLLERLDEFRNSAELAKTSIEGGPAAFRNSVVDKCIDQANQTKTRLGTLRRKLHQERKDEPYAEQSSQQNANLK